MIFFLICSYHYGGAKLCQCCQAKQPEEEPPIALVPDENVLRGRPLTAFVNPRGRVSSTEVFEALDEAGIDTTSLSCVQRHSSGEIVLTFPKTRFKEQFLRQNVLNLRGVTLVVQDVDKPLTYLLIFNAIICLIQR